MALRSCIVSFVSSTLIRDSVELSSETLYEAAAMGLALLKKDGWVPCRIRNLIGMIENPLDVARRGCQFTKQ